MPALLLLPAELRPLSPRGVAVVVLRLSRLFAAGESISALLLAGLEDEDEDDDEPALRLLLPDRASL